MIKYQFIPMNRQYADAIVNWHYEDIYSFYDLSQDTEDQGEILDSDHMRNHYYTVVDNAQELSGIFLLNPREIP